MIALLAAAALAQDLVVPETDVQMYRLPIDGAALLWTEDADRWPTGHSTVRLAAGYAHRPLVAEWRRSGERVDVVAGATRLDVLAGHTWRFVRLGVDLPVYATASGDLSSGGGLGDVEIDARTVLLEGGVNPVGFALSTRVGLPTSTVDLPLGAAGPTLLAMAVADVRPDPLRLAVNAGVRVQPAAEFGEVRIDDAFVYRAGAGLPLGDGGLSVDVGGQIALSGALTGAPAEVLAGGWYRVGSSVVVRGGAGAGIGRGIGSPAARGLVAVGWEPPPNDDTDGDGVRDHRDDDDDADGVADAADACPLAAEDDDGWRDTDGCPDDRTSVTLVVTDPLGLPVPGVAIVVTGPETVQAKSEDAIELLPGTWTLRADAPGYRSLSARIVVPAGAPIQVAQTMNPDVVLGSVRLDVRGPDGAAVPYRIAIDGAAPGDPTTGVAETSLLPGDHAITVSADGYAPVTVTARVAPADTTTLEVRLEAP